MKLGAADLQAHHHNNARCFGIPHKASGFAPTIRRVWNEEEGSAVMVYLAIVLTRS
jgi:hypothetical protein